MLRSLFAILAVLMVAGAASAQFGPETLVRGDLKIDVNCWIALGSAVETISRSYGDAETTIGSINAGSHIGGNANIKVKADDVTTKALSRGDACTAVGSVGGCGQEPLRRR